MQHIDLISALESGSDPVLPDDAPIRVLTSDGMVFDILDVKFDEENRTIWLVVEDGEE